MGHIIAMDWERNNLVKARDKMHDPLAASYRCCQPRSSTQHER
jgi:hypothetical protein